MNRFTLTCSLLLALQSIVASPQGPGPMRPEAVASLLERQPENATLHQILPGLLASYHGDAAIKEEASQLAAQAATAEQAGDSATSRERSLHAIALLLGKPWTPEDRFAASITIAPSQQIADAERPFTVSLTQTYPSSYTPASGLVAHLLLAKAPPPGPPIEIPGTPRSGPPPELDWHDLAHIPISNPDLIAKPVQLSTSLAGDAGDYLLAVDIYQGDTRIARTIVPIAVVHDLARRQASIQSRLARVKGSDVTRQSILYPFDLARMINSHRRTFIHYDFDAGIRRSGDLLSALQAGHDPLWRAKGRTEQAYDFTEAGEISPFGVYVPTTWDGHTPLKLLLILHGVNEDQNSMLDRDGGIIPAAAEQHNYLVVTPNGYRTDGFYGSTNKPGQPGGPPIGGTYTAAELQRIHLSELDVLNVLAAVEKEYPVDLTHVDLMGQSMGGAGAWYLAQKYPDKWAALVATAAAGIEQPYPYERLRGMPILCGAGTRDGLLPYTRDQAAALNALGIPAEYHEVKDATHHTIVAEMLPDIFQFIDTHQKAGAGEPAPHSQPQAASATH